MTRAEILQIAKPILFNTDMVKAILDGRKTVTRRKIDIDIINNCDMEADGTLLDYQNEYGDFINPVKLCRYQKGNYLYVRETWSEWTDGYVYKAWTSPFPQPGRYADEFMTWHPSIHMPKEAVRIFLRVTDVRVERLKNLSVGDLKAEGIDCSGFLGEHPTLTAGNLFSKFEEIWNSTIPKKDLSKYGWNANPYVWAIQFERVEV